MCGICVGKRVSLCTLLLTFIIIFEQQERALSLPELGKARFNLNKDSDYGVFAKVLYKDTAISLKGACHHEGTKLKLNFQWKLLESKCAEQFIEMMGKVKSDTIWRLTAYSFLRGSGTIPCDPHNGHISIGHLVKPKEEPKVTTNGTQLPNDETQLPNDETQVTTKGQVLTKTRLPTTTQLPTNALVTSKPKADDEAPPEEPTNERKGSSEISGAGHDMASDADLDGKRHRRSIESLQLKPHDGLPPKLNGTLEDHSDLLLRTKKSQAYLLIFKVNIVKHSAESELTVDPKADKFVLTVDLSMRGKHGYLSATEWPLLPFFGVMSLVYLGYLIGWFIASCCNWRDLLRVQFWVGGVLALGMLEKALFYSEYQNINDTGEANKSHSLIIVAELVSCVKRGLARILVIIVSMGFGIVKPRLGSALPKVLACGLLYIVLASVEGCYRAVSPKAKPGRSQVIAAIPLAVLDSVICWWIFTALIQTTRTLRIRKNTVKLTLYKHFTNTLIFAVLASITYMVWTIKSHTFSKCRDWTDVWLDDAFWPFLFSIVLLVIMILWRPTNNNQRYAFTPLVDLSDDEDPQTLSEAFDGIYMRSIKRQDSNGAIRKHKSDDDLKWVEENIPSIPKSVLGHLDSDEELMTTKLEMSKME